MLSAHRQRVLYRYGLRHADRIIVQTHHQQNMLREHFGLIGDVLPMPCEDTVQDRQVIKGRSSDSSSVLWIGRFAEQKRLEWLLDVAERLPQYRFDVVGGPNSPSAYATALQTRGRTIANVVLHGPLARSELGRLYQGAICLCSTAGYEGFPNTFLEAWSYGLPVISSVDPDGIIAQFGLGRVATSVDGLVREIDTLARSPELWDRISTAAREYYAANHTLDRSMGRFESLFQDVVRRFGLGYGRVRPSTTS